MRRGDAPISTVPSSPPLPSPPLPVQGYVTGIILAASASLSWLSNPLLISVKSVQRLDESLHQVYRDKPISKRFDLIVLFLLILPINTRGRGCSYMQQVLREAACWF